MQKFKSIAVWPDGIVHNPEGTNITEDFHDTYEQANGVIRRLNREGFGGEGKCFPISTSVEQNNED